MHVRGGAEIVGLVADPRDESVPLAPVVVRGVRLADGSEETFDLTVVASGRRGALPAWLEAIGAGDVPEVSDESGIVYFSRFYELLPGSELPPRTGPIGGDLGYLKYGVFAGDNGTFSLTLAAATDDTVMRRLLDDDEVFELAGRSLTFTAPYLDGRAEPITGVHKIAGLISRWREYVIDGRPLAIGVVPIGDAMLATNPLYGRGCSTGFWAAHLLAEKLRTHSDDLTAALMAYYADVESELHPWVVATMKTDADARRYRRRSSRARTPTARRTTPSGGSGRFCVTACGRRCAPTSWCCGRSCGTSTCSPLPTRSRPTVSSSRACSPRGPSATRGHPSRSSARPATRCSRCWAQPPADAARAPHASRSSRRSPNHWSRRGRPSTSADPFAAWMRWVT